MPLFKPLRFKRRLIDKFYKHFYRFSFAKIVPTLRKLHSYREQGGFFGISFSQLEQDLFVVNYYLNKPKQIQYVFVDIGANDGVTFSNSYLLENLPKSHWAYQNWRGILIEADKNVYDLLAATRPNTAKYNVALCDRDGEVEFLQVEGDKQMLSGLVSEYGESHLARLRREIAEGGGGNAHYKNAGRAL